MAQEVLVTGAAGFIGRHISRLCVTMGWRVTTLDKRVAPADVLSRTEFRRADQTHPATLQDIRDGRFAAVLHHAGTSSTMADDWSALHGANVAKPIELATASAQGGSRFIYASSHSVYGHILRRGPVPEDADDSRCSGPLNLYAQSKLQLDNAMASRFPAGLRWVGLRYTNVFGSGEEHKGRMASIISQLLRRAARGEELLLFDDTARACRDYVPVEVVAATCVELVGASVPSGVYNLGSGVPTSFAEVVDWCEEFSSTPLRVRLVPNPLSQRYQYWTCADTRKLDRALAERPVTSAEDVRLAAKTLFAEFRDDTGDAAHHGA